MTGANISLATLLGTFPSKVRTLILKNTGTGSIFFGNSAMVKATLVGVIDKIAPGERYVIGGYRNIDDIDWTSFSLAGDNNGDVVIVSGQTVS